MAGITTTHEVEWGECDAAGIVFFPNYFRWMDNMFHEICTAAGFDPRSLKTKGDIDGTPVVENGCKFHVATSFGDKLEIGATVTRVGNTGLSIAYTFRLGETLIAEGQEARVFVRETEDGLIKARIPDVFRSGLEKLHDG